MKQVYLGVAMTAASLLMGLSASSLDLNSITFDQAPRLSRIAIANRTVYFTIAIPENAGENLAKISVSDLEPEGSRLPFNLENTQVFVGDRAIAFNSVWVDETGVIWIDFDPALMPGTTFILTFGVSQNPPSGTRNYSLAAYPDAENSVPTFVGDGSLNFKR